MALTPDTHLCVYHCLTEYLKRTQTLQSDLEQGQLFISFNKPHKKVSRETIRRWIKQVMILAGIDVQIFKPHSTRAASTSAATKADEPISEILKVAAWKTDCTSSEYYNKPILTSSSEYTDTILSS